MRKMKPPAWAALSRLSPGTRSRVRSANLFHLEQFQLEWGKRTVGQGAVAPARCSPSLARGDLAHGTTRQTTLSYHFLAEEVVRNPRSVRVVDGAAV
jgi:hypothetical protein